MSGSSGSSSGGSSASGGSSSSASGIVGPILNLVGLGISAGKARSAAREQMGHEEWMSDTAYQRSVRDMKAAGLNPAMMYGNAGGGPASSGHGSVADVPDFSSIGSSAMQAQRLSEELKLIEQNTATSYADQRNKEVDSQKKASEIEVNNHLGDQIRAETRLKNANSALVESGLPEADANRKLWEGLKDSSPAVKALQRILESFGIGAGRSR